MSVLSTKKNSLSRGEHSKNMFEMLSNSIKRFVGRLWFKYFANGVKSASPSELKELVAKGTSFWGELYNVDSALVRSWGGRRLEINPFVKVLSLQGQSDDLLREYLEIVESLNDVDSISVKIENRGYPWDETSRSTPKTETLHRELAKYGYEGPETPLAECEIKRLLQIHESIQKSGYDHKLGVGSPLLGDLLEMNGKVVILIRHGEHRAAAMYANGYEKIPVLLSSSRIYSMSGDQKNFDSNYYSINEIKKIFTLIHNGDEIAPLFNIKGYFFDSS